MKIAIAKEVDAAEPRVAATPDTVKKFKALGIDIAIEPGAGIKSGLLDADYEAAGAVVSADAVKDADLVIKVKRPETSRALQIQEGCAGHRDHGPLRQRCRAQGDGRCRRLGLRDGADAAHHPRAGDGRAVLAGQPCGIPCRRRSRRSLWPRLPDDDDRRRYCARRESVCDGRRALLVFRPSPLHAASAPS